MKVLILANLTLIALAGSTPAVASSSNCTRFINRLALAEARKVDSTGNFNIATSFQFQDGTQRVVIDDGPWTITVDMVLDASCRVLSVSTNDDIDNANGG